MQQLREIDRGILVEGVGMVVLIGCLVVQVFLCLLLCASLVWAPR